jgi:hypothetical protein
VQKYFYYGKIYSYDEYLVKYNLKTIANIMHSVRVVWSDSQQSFYSLSKIIQRDATIYSFTVSPFILKSILFTHQQMHYLLNLEGLNFTLEFTWTSLLHVSVFVHHQGTNFSQAQYKLPDAGRRPKHVGAKFMWIIV